MLESELRATNAEQSAFQRWVLQCTVWQLGMTSQGVQGMGTTHPDKQYHFMHHLPCDHRIVVMSVGWCAQNVLYSFQNIFHPSSPSPLPSPSSLSPAD